MKMTSCMRPKHVTVIHLYFTKTSTCESHSIIANTLNVKNKPLKLLELQHVSVFHKTILREPLVPVKVTYYPLLFFRVCWQHVLFYLWWVWISCYSFSLCWFLVSVCVMRGISGSLRMVLWKTETCWSSNNFSGLFLTCNVLTLILCDSQVHVLVK